MSEYASGSDPGTPAGSGGRSPSFVARGQLPMSTSGRQAFPKQLSEKYRLGEELGRGAYGRVYRGLDARTGEQVAIKQISLTRIPTGALASLVTEVELLKALNHCNVVQYLGSFRTRTDLYIIMELVENGSLAAVIKAQQFGPFPEPLVGMFIHQVLQGLAYLHDQGVVHRDIKGANILTTKDGVVKLADFGVAARLGDSNTGGGGGGGGDTTTTTNDAAGEETQPAGTPYWMAPEVVELKTVTTASDIWSVGCLAVELLTGQPPYYELQPLSALYNIVQNPHPPLPTIASPSMLDFLLQCFRKDPTSRPSAKELLQHPWVLHNRRTLRSTWGTKTGQSETNKDGVHASVATAVQRFLDADSRPASVDSRGGSETTSPKHGHGAPTSSISSGAVTAAAVLSGAGIETSGTTYSDFSAAMMSSAEETLNNLQIEFLRHVDADATGTQVLDALAELSLKEPTMSSSSHGGSAGGGSGVAVGGRDGGGGGAGQLRRVGSATAMHDEAEIRRQTASLRVMASSGERSIIEEAAAAASARALVNYLSDDPLLRKVFINMDGLCGIRELLDSPSERVLGPTLDLLLALTTEDPAAMEMACAMGLIPAALRVAGSPHPVALRLRAARLATALARSSASGAHMLIACQGVPFFMSMMDDAPQSPEQLELLRAAVGGFWAVLHRSLTPGWPLSTNSYLRLMTHHGLPIRLVKAMPWVLKLASLERSSSGVLLGVASSVGVGVAGSSGGALVRPTTTSPAVTRSGIRPSNRIVPEETLIGTISTQNINNNGTRGSRDGSGKSSSTTTVAAIVPATTDSQLLESLVDLFAALAHGDATVKARCCPIEVINHVFGFTVRMPTHLQLRILKAVYRLSTEQSVLGALEAANVVAYVVAQLPRQDAPELQVEALCTVHNLCQLSRSRQEATAAAGAVPWLCQLAVQPPLVLDAPAEVESARSAAISALCLLCHCSPRTRAELWSHGGLDVLMQLLKEEAHQVTVLEALASWLEAELPRIEGQLLEGTALTRLILVLPSQGQPSHQDQLPSLLSPLGRMISRSPKLAVALTQAGLAARVVELLKRPTPPAALALMDLLQSLYEAHPHPKEFIAQNRVGQALATLAQGAQAGSQVLVRTRANNLLQAFSVNAVF
jgi:serine/threonine protein kinase